MKRKFSDFAEPVQGIGEGYARFTCRLCPPGSDKIYARNTLYNHVHLCHGNDEPGGQHADFASDSSDLLGDILGQIPAASDPVPVECQNDALSDLLNGVLSMAPSRSEGCPGTSTGQPSHDCDQDLLAQMAGGGDSDDEEDTDSEDPDGLIAAFEALAEAQKVDFAIVFVRCHMLYQLECLTIPKDSIQASTSCSLCKCNCKRQSVFAVHLP